MIATIKLSPLMKQYNEIKQKYSDAIVLFKVIDFYESFGTCAKTLSEVTGVTLTETKDGQNLAGFELSFYNDYLTKLIKAGHRVAICESSFKESKTFNRNIRKSLS